MPNKSAALEKEMKVRSAKPNKWLRFYRCIPAKQQNSNDTFRCI